MSEIQHPQPFVKHILMVVYQYPPSKKFSFFYTTQYPRLAAPEVAFSWERFQDEILIPAFTMNSMMGIEDETLS